MNNIELPKQNISLWKNPKNIKLSTKVFSRKEIELIFNTLKDSKDYPENDFGKFQKARDYSCLNFMYWCALRPAEACKIRFKDIDLKNSLLFINGTSNKTGKDRIIPLSKQILPVLKEYLKMPEKYWKESDYLFPSAENSFISASTMKTIFREKILKPCGLYEPAGKGKSPKDCRTRLYSLRKSRASHLLEDSKDLFLCQNFLGHSDIRVTASYYIHTNSEYLKYMKQVVNGEIKATKKPDIQINQVNNINILVKQINILEKQNKVILEMLNQKRGENPALIS